MTKNNLPILGLTIGDAAGIGPEIIAGAWNEIQTQNNSLPFILGHTDVIKKALKLRNVSAEVVEIDPSSLSIKSFREMLTEMLSSDSAVLPCWTCCQDDILEVQYGLLDARAGQGAFDALTSAIQLAKTGIIDGIVTAPLNKKSLHMAGHFYPGHTEILAEACDVQDFAMMLYLGPQENLQGKYGIAVDHVTLHTAMKNVFELITEKSVYEKIALLHDFVSKIKGSRPKLGVCSLNCHGGEEGLFGDEEIRTIRPAVERAAADGMDVCGPFPADTIMVRAKNGLLDGVVAMFHDQGHIALKLLGMQRAVNITLGLPIVRTSVAHGTAFDLAGKGIAETGSLVEAVRCAALLTRKSPS